MWQYFLKVSSWEIKFMWITACHAKDFCLLCNIQIQCANLGSCRVRVKAKELLFLLPFEIIPWSSLGTQTLFIFFHLPFHPTNSFTELHFSRGDLRSWHFSFIEPKEPNCRCSQIGPFPALKLMLNILPHYVTRKIWTPGLGRATSCATWCGI